MLTKVTVEAALNVEPDEHGLIVNRKHVRRLMVLMGIRAVYPGNKGTSKPDKAHRIYPYLLRNIEINHSN
jgi:putative transposase